MDTLYGPSGARNFSLQRQMRAHSQRPGLPPRVVMCQNPDSLKGIPPPSRLPPQGFSLKPGCPETLLLRLATHSEIPLPLPPVLELKACTTTKGRLKGSLPALFMLCLKESGRARESVLSKEHSQCGPLVHLYHCWQLQRAPDFPVSPRICPACSLHPSCQQRWAEAL